MNISPINYNSKVLLRADNSKQEVKSIKDRSVSQIMKYPPAAIGAVNGLCWGIIGFGFDRVFSMLFGTNSSKKTSLKVNALIGLGIGLYTYFHARKANKSQKTEGAVNS